LRIYHIEFIIISIIIYLTQMCVYQMLLIERTLLVVYHSVALLREPSIAIGKRSHSPGHRSSSHDQWPLFDKVRIVKPFRSTV